MNKKLKIAMLIVISTMLVMGFYVRDSMAEEGVDKGDFDAAWKEAYESLPPEAQEAFLEETMKAFEDGEIGYAADKPVADTKTVDRTDRTPRDATRGTRTDRPGPGRGGQQYDRPINPYAVGPVLVPGMHGRTLKEQEDDLKSKGLSDKEVKTILDVQKGLLEEAAKIDPTNLSPKEARKIEEKLIQEFEAKTGFNPGRLFGSPAGPGGAEGTDYAPAPGSPQPGPDGPHPGPNPEEERAFLVEKFGEDTTNQLEALRREGDEAYEGGMEPHEIEEMMKAKFREITGMEPEFEDGPHGPPLGDMPEGAIPSELVEMMQRGEFPEGPPPEIAAMIEKGEFNEGQMPDFEGQMPDFEGQMPDFEGQMPDFESQMPDFESQMPDFEGQMPEPPQ